MVNKEIFVMITFFVSIVSMLGLVINSGITAQPQQLGTINTGNVSVVQSNFGGSSSCTVVSNSTEPFAQNQIINGLYQVVNQIAVQPIANAYNIIAGIFNQKGIVVNGGTLTQTNNAQCAQQLQTSENLNFYSTGKIVNYNVPPVSDIGSLVVECLAIAGIFVGLGLLAGTLGAGQLAPIVSAVGIGISLIFFMQSVLASKYFVGEPFILQIFLTGITGVFFIWIVITLLRD